MKHTTEQWGIRETVQEISDVIAIARSCIDVGDTELAKTNLAQAENYIKHVLHKVDIALKHVPESVKEKEFL